MTIRLSALLLLLIVAAASALSQSNSKEPPSNPTNGWAAIARQYFPTGVFGPKFRNWDQSELKAEWYAGHLRNMSEPSLLQSSMDKTFVAYRFLWLRTFHNPIAIRITMRPDGTASLKAIVTNGSGGYAPGNVSLNESFDLTASQVAGLLAQLDQSRYWTLPTEILDGPNGTDGAQWIVEGVKDESYHVVDRWSPKAGPYKAMCLYFLSLSKIQIKPDEIY